MNKSLFRVFLVAISICIAWSDPTDAVTGLPCDFDSDNDVDGDDLLSWQSAFGIGDWDDGDEDTDSDGADFLCWQHHHGSQGVLSSDVVMTIPEPSLDQLRTVALSGDHAPGTPADAVYGWFEVPAMNSSGQTAFNAHLRFSLGGVERGNERGIWSEGSGSLGLVARVGSPAPGWPSEDDYYSFSSRSPTINATGEVAFGALSGNGSNQLSGIWSGQVGSLELVAHTEGDAPGVSNAMFISFDNNFGDSSVLQNDLGQTAFVATISGTGVDNTNNLGIWSEGFGPLGLVARNGEHAPSTSSGVNFGPFGFSDLAFNSSGQTAFFSILSGSNIDSTNDTALWLGGPDSLELIAQEGAQASGTPSGVSYGNFVFGYHRPALNAAGQTAFMGLLTGLGIDGSNDIGIWSGDSSSVELVARTGEHAPDTPADVVFSFFGESRKRVALLNSAGATVFKGSLSGPGIDSTNDKGIWSEGFGSLGLVAREGDPAPETPSGVNFRDFDDYVMNSSGQTAFLGYLTGSDIDIVNWRGIWAEDTNGSLRKIAREGDLLEVLPGDFRTISELHFIAGTGNEDGRPSGFNDDGQLAFKANFTDGSSGVFVSNVVAIPEPSSCMLFALSFLCLQTIHSVQRER